MVFSFTRSGMAGVVLVVLMVAGNLRAQELGQEIVVVASPEPESVSGATDSDDARADETTSDAERGDKGEKTEVERLRQERDRLAAENALATEKTRRELKALEAEKQRLQLENSLRTERLNSEMAELRTRIDKVGLETEEINKQAALESARRRAALDTELADMRAEEERARLANSIGNQKTEAQIAEMRLRESEFKVQRAELDMDVARLQTELTRREKAEVLRDIVPEERVYSKEPFADGVLRISDRRIGLNGVIVQSIANHVAERIDYYNNQNTEYPIFLVIDYSPGGSVMAGYKILKAMEGSQAPVYVVVKSYAASMSAVITTLASRSYAYPNAIIVHHQMSWLGVGNLTQQREQLQEAENWWRRLAQPVAAKMGLTLDQLISEMYKRNSDGNWREFADAANGLKWIDQVVDTIWETSMDKNPDRFGSAPVITLQLEEKTDEQGSPYMLLPRLPPSDYYFLLNPDGYFRVR